MDRCKHFGHRVVEALTKARELQAFALDSESKARVKALMERARKAHQTVEGLAKASAANGKGLDKATLNEALDRLIETMDGVNRELEDLLAKAKGK